MNKQNIRNNIRIQFKKLNEFNKKKDKDRQVISNLKKIISKVPKSNKLLIYYPFQDESDISNVYNELNRNKNLYYATFDLGYLDYSQVNKINDLKSNVVKTDFRIFDVILLPGRAYTLSGDRLGRGGGWYDRVLSLCRETVIKIGVCYEFQILENLPIEDHDQRVDYLVTEERFLFLNSK